MTLDDDRRVATNALWVFTHFALADNEWLYAKHDQLIDRCLNEKDATKLRLMLNLLLRQPFDEEAIRTDFIDFCLTQLADPKSPYAVRAQCIKLAYEQMRYWPELLNELRQMLEMISFIVIAVHANSNIVRRDFNRIYVFGNSSVFERFLDISSVFERLFTRLS